MNNNLFNKIDLNKKGLQRVFGKLEVSVIEELWQSGQATVRQIHERLKDKGLAYTTVMTVMSRLVSKNILAREMRGNAFVYKALVNEEDVNNTMVQELSDSFKDLSTRSEEHTS